MTRWLGRHVFDPARTLLTEAEYLLREDEFKWDPVDLHQVAAGATPATP
jgi:hypothetical protein